MKRCLNCGWDNPDSATMCEKCQTALNGAYGEPSYEGYGNPLQGTMREKSIASAPINVTIREDLPTPGAFPENGPMNGMDNQCPRCGYPAAPGQETCPQCGKALIEKAPEPKPYEAPAWNAPAAPKPTENESAAAQPARPAAGNSPLTKTVPFWFAPTQFDECTLTPMAWPNEKHVPEAQMFTETTVLNRANTDPKNPTITSKEQALLSVENGQWYLEDKSEHHTTLIAIKRKIKLEDGDTIIFGNRFFEFHC